MSTVPDREVAEGRRGRGPRRGLQGMMLVVLGAGGCLGLVSRARGLELPASPLEVEEFLARCSVVVLMPIAVALIAVLVMNLFHQGSSRAERWNNAWPWIWRVLAIVFLIAFLAEAASVLQVVSSARGGAVPKGAELEDLRHPARLYAIPTLGVLMMAGVVLGMRPARPRRHVRESALLPGLSALIASLGGVAIVANLMIVPYLVVIAVECVANALQQPGAGTTGMFIPEPGLPMPRGIAERLDAAVPITAVAALCCLITAGWLGAGLRKSALAADEAADDRAARRILRVGLLLTAVLPGLAGVLVVRVLPLIQPMIYEGLLMAVGPWQLAAFAGAFSVFSVGLVAHAVTASSQAIAEPSEATRTGFPVLPRAILKWAAVAALAALIVSCVDQVVQGIPWLEAGVPGWLRALLLRPVHDRSLWLWGWLTNPASYGGLLFMSEPILCAPVLAIPWLCWCAVRLLMADDPLMPSGIPLDQVLNTRFSRRRFAGYGLALTSLMVAALPVLALSGLILLHRGLNPAAR